LDNLRERVYFEELGIDAVAKMMLKKQGVRGWIKLFGF
jgi:hypothetical protein